MRTLIEEITFKTRFNTFTAEVAISSGDFEIIALEAKGDISDMLNDETYFFLKKELELHVQERWTDAKNQKGEAA